MKRSLSHSLGVAEVYTLLGMILFGITYGVIAVVIALIFGYEPNARRFKLSIALALTAISVLIFIAAVDNKLQYPSVYDAYDILWPLAHALVVLLISQIAARKYIAELNIDRT